MILIIKEECLGGKGLNRHCMYPVVLYSHIVIFGLLTFEEFKPLLCVGTEILKELAIPCGMLCCDADNAAGLLFCSPECSLSVAL